MKPDKRQTICSHNRLTWWAKRQLYRLALVPVADFNRTERDFMETCMAYIRKKSSR